jgi:hypothetical protein
VPGRLFRRSGLRPVRSNHLIWLFDYGYYNYEYYNYEFTGRRQHYQSGYFDYGLFVQLGMGVRYRAIHLDRRYTA